MEDEVEDTEEIEWETGPFCRHWSDPSDCDALCKCGHKCCEHSIWEDYECKECDCQRFVDEDDEAG